MDQQLKAKWVEALRSNTYRKGTGFLQRTTDDNEPQFCALGVLLDVSGVGKWLPDAPGHRVSYLMRNADGIPYYMTTGLTRALRERFGLTEEQQDKVIELNDNGGFTLNRISDWIEAYL